MAPGLAMLNTRYLIGSRNGTAFAVQWWVGPCLVCRLVQWVNSAEEEIASRGLDPARDCSGARIVLRKSLNGVGNPGA